MATCLASFVGMVCMAFLANKPFCMAPGMGLNSYTIMKIFGGKAKEVSVLTYVISALFLVKFFLAV